VINDYSNNKFYQIIDVRYKDENNFWNTRSKYDYQITFNQFEESHKSYLRNTITNYLNIKTLNYEYRKGIDISGHINTYNAYKYDTSLKTLTYDLSVNTIPYLYDQSLYSLQTNNEFNNLADTTKYSMIGLSKISYNTGITSTAFNKEFIEQTNVDNIIIYPTISTTTNKIFVPYQLNSGATIYERYPVYEYAIQPGKYNELTLTQYFNTLFTNVNKKYYNYQKEAFINDNVYNNIINLNNVTDDQNQTRMIININKNISSLEIKYYKTIFSSSSKNYIPDTSYLSYNDGFPYLHFNIPSVSIPNSSFIYITGASNLDNIPISDINKEHIAIIPKNYREMKLRPNLVELICK
jgi:hypothetical protein